MSEQPYAEVEVERLRAERDYWKGRAESAWVQGDVDGSLIWRQSAEIANLRALLADLPEVERLRAKVERLRADNAHLRAELDHEHA